MGRGATKAAGNVYYKARIEAAKWNDRLCSREGAAEALGVSNFGSVVFLSQEEAKEAASHWMK